MEKMALFEPKCLAQWNWYDWQTSHRSNFKI